MILRVGLRGGFDEGVRVVERCELFSHLANLGDARSLILHPASTTHSQLTTEQRKNSGAGDDVIRMSIGEFLSCCLFTALNDATIGLEDASDLIKDLEYALKAV